MVSSLLKTMQLESKQGRCNSLLDGLHISDDALVVCDVVGLAGNRQHASSSSPIVHSQFSSMQCFATPRLGALYGFVTNFGWWNHARFML
jgi:hypothetical protein